MRGRIALSPTAQLLLATWPETLVITFVTCTRSTHVLTCTGEAGNFCLSRPAEWLDAIGSLKIARELGEWQPYFRRLYVNSLIILCRRVKVQLAQFFVHVWQ